MNPFAQVEKLRADPQYAKPGWDTYAAKPISLDTFAAASLFAAALPEDCRDCHVAPEASGEIAFDWDPRCASADAWEGGWVTLEVDAAGEVEWDSWDPGASPKSKFGKFTFDGAIPEDLIEAIRSVK